LTREERAELWWTAQGKAVPPKGTMDYDAMMGHWMLRNIRR